MFLGRRTRISTGVVKRDFLKGLESLLREIFLLVNESFCADFATEEHMIEVEMYPVYFYGECFRLDSNLALSRF